MRKTTGNETAETITRHWTARQVMSRPIHGDGRPVLGRATSTIPLQVVCPPRIEQSEP